MIWSNSKVTTAILASALVASGGLALPQATIQAGASDSAAIILPEGLLASGTTSTISDVTAWTTVQLGATALINPRALADVVQGHLVYFAAQSENEWQEALDKASARTNAQFGIVSEGSTFLPVIWNSSICNATQEKCFLDAFRSGALESVAPDAFAVFFSGSNISSALDGKAVLLQR